MIYRIPLDHCGIKKIIYSRKKDTLKCPEHGDMNIVTIINKEGKEIAWFRCLWCHIGAAYDFDPSSNPSYVKVEE